MAITQAAKKAIRSSARKRVFNLRRMRTMKKALRNTRELALGGKLEEAKNSLSTAYKAIDKAVKRGIIKANTASRKKSRLSKFLKSKST